MGGMNQGETTHMAVPAFCSPLTTALYAAFGICGFVFALVGSAFSVYGRTMFISLGLSITVLGCLGVLTNYKQWWLRTMMVNALNFFVFIALIVMTLLAVIFAYDIRDPVGEGVAETWSGPTGIRVTDLEPNDYCEDSLDADQVARDGVDAVKNTGECNRFYSWARAMSKSNPIERCASLDEPLTSDTRVPCALKADGMGCKVKGGDCKFTNAISATASCDTAAGCQEALATCTGAHDGTKGATCAMNAANTDCKVKGGDCVLAPNRTVCIGTYDGSAGNACGLNPTKTACMVAGKCKFTQGSCSAPAGVNVSAATCHYTPASASPSSCTGSDDGTGEAGGKCPFEQCTIPVATMATNCRQIIASTGKNGPCDSTGAHMKECFACDVACKKMLIDDLQESMSLVPYVCYFVFFFLCITLLYNVWLMDMADDIDTFHDFMEMEASTLGVGHFIEDRPKFEGTPLQRTGLMINIFVIFLGFLVATTATIVLIAASEHFSGIATFMLLDGLTMLGLAIGVYTGVKQNRMGLVRLCNLLLFMFCFLTLCLGLVMQLGTGSTKDLHERVDADYVDVLRDIEFDDPTYCGLPTGPNTCTGTHDGTLGKPCALNAAKNGCAVTSGDCNFYPNAVTNANGTATSVCNGTSDASAGNPCALAADGMSCAVAGGSLCSFAITRPHKTYPRLTAKACKDKIILDMQENIEIVAYVGVCLTTFMAVIMWLTHTMASEYYRGHNDSDEVPGKLDNWAKQKIQDKTDHVRRLSPEHLATIEKWKYAKKQGLSGIAAATSDELVIKVITSIHSDDNIRPHQEEAVEYLEKGDEYVRANRPVHAGAAYQHGRDIEPGNPMLKSRQEAVRRYLVQRGELQKMIDTYNEGKRVGTLQEQQRQAGESVQLFEVGSTDDFFNRNRTKGKVKVSTKAAAASSNQVSASDYE